MKHVFASALVLFGLTVVDRAAAQSPIDEALPIVGTGGHGHTYPGATVPFGFVQVSPDTRRDTWDGSSGYHYSDSKILGFSHTHLSGTGVGDLGDILLMPVTGPLQSKDYQPLDTVRLASPFSHDNEMATPGFYHVTLDRYHIVADLTATAHCGVHRYVFPAAADESLIVDLASGISNHVTAAELMPDGNTRLTGWRTTNGWADHRTVYFVLESDRPWSSLDAEADNKPVSGSTADVKAKIVRAALHFGTSDKPLTLRVGLSAVSVDGAQENLDAEVKNSDFDELRAAAQKLWESNLSRIDITASDPSLRRTFYSALYHTMLAPTLYNDADGSYRGLDDKVHQNEGFDNYSTFSMWDTFRAEHPLLTIIEPERVNDFVRTALSFYQQSHEHALPMWPLANWETHCMVGYHCVPVIYDAYAKGFRGFDANLALQAMQDTALRSHNCPSDYEARGYVVSDPKKNDQAASRTLEYSYDDWCISQMAAALGKKDVEDHFARRSQFFLNLFDKTSGFFRGRTAAGGWAEPFDPKAIDFHDYTEANAWQYAFFAPHDMPALTQLYGGNAGFVQKLDACFNQESDIHKWLNDVSGLVGQYSQGNEPCHNMAYLYALAGAQDKTAWRVREIMRLLYDDTPEGICGNDDCGQMSAWYVWSAIGLYPVNPANQIYVIGSPIVEKATIRLDPKLSAGVSFTVIAHGVSNQAIYVKSAKLNGQPLAHPWITHDELMHGGTLELEMSMLPSGLWSH